MAITTTMRTQVTQLYVSLFGRAPDAGGLGYWVGQLDGGKTIQAVAQEIYNSPEARAYGYSAASTNSEIIAKFYTNVLGRTADDTGLAFWTAKLNTVGVTKGSVFVEIINAVANYAGTDTVQLASQTLLSNKVDAGLYYGYTLGSNDVAGSNQILSGVTADPASVTAAKAAFATANPAAFTLTTGVDNITGTIGDDTFTANFANNANTFQSGDKITGGSGNDTLKADVGNSANFAILATTSSVENVYLRAEAVRLDSNQNNINQINSAAGTANNDSTVNAGSTVDAQNMVGVNHWVTDNSRATVVIEDVRIQNSQITKDIVLEMLNTDPSSVNTAVINGATRANSGFEVYFDPESLRAAPATTNGAVLTVRILDVKAAGLTPTTPLADSPYDGFTFKLDGVIKSIKSTAIDNATNYADLLTAVSAALTTAKLTDASLVGFTATLSGTFTAKDADTGIDRTGQVVVLTNTGSGVITTDSATGFTTATGVVPSNSNLYTNIAGAPPATTTNLITSTILLDNVGRSDEAGNLIVGSMATRGGVERFEITAKDTEAVNQARTGGVNGAANGIDGNWITSASSTNNVLQEVQLKNSTGSIADLYIGSALPAGNDLVSLRAPATLLQTNGLTDVRLVDGSTFAGDLKIGAAITANSITKYMNIRDTQAVPSADNIKFDYKLGAGNDTLNLTIDGGVLASNSKIVAGREDFSLSVDGGAGNDVIQVRIVDGLSGGAQNWYNNQDLNNNVTISGGEGNDTIRKLGAGDTTIDGGAGNDTIYTDNTGLQTISTLTATAGVRTTSTSMAQWVFNTTDQATPVALVRDINDLRSDASNTYNLFNTKLVVSFKGIPNAATVIVPNATYKTSDLQINQAIKDAINNDAVLNKLLVAEDGPANTLIVKSLIDGVMTTTDLTVSLTGPVAGTLTTADIAAAGLAYGITTSTVPATEASVLAAIAASLATYATKGDYATALANDGFANISGVASTSTSDNLITPGTGNDVVVLGTTLGLTAALSSNEVIKFAPSFGDDVILNFNATGAGIDHLDFVALGGSVTATAGFNEAVRGTTANSITVVSGSTANDTVLKIAALYNVDSTVARTHIYVTVDTTSVGGTNNVATVYQVADAAGVAAGNVVVTKAGTIDLGATSFTSLTAANFVDSSAANYFLVEGPTGFVSTGTGTGTGTGTATPVAVSAANTVSAAGSDFAYSIAMGNYAYSINGFSAGDKIVSPTGVTGTLANSSFTDGNATVQYAANGQIVTVTLTGLSPAQDSALFSTGDLNTVFGAGTFV